MPSKTKEERARDALWADVIKRAGGNLSKAVQNLTRLDEDGNAVPYSIGHVRRIVSGSKYLTRITTQARKASYMPNRGPRAKVSTARLLEYDPYRTQTLNECAKYFDVSERRIAVLRAQMDKAGQ